MVDRRLVQGVAVAAALLIPGAVWADSLIDKLLRIAASPPPRPSCADLATS